MSSFVILSARPYIRYVVRFLLIAVLVGMAPLLVNSQSVTTEFGKNRIQFHDDFDTWNMYETENFVTYWYGKGREIAHTVVQMAELDNPSIQNVLEHKMNDKIELIIYLDLTDMKQSNLGIEEQFTSERGITKVVENKVFLYFNGNHNDLRKSLREGIASVYINSMLHGNNLQEIVQNAVLLNLPDWFQEGLVSYMGEEWNSQIESDLKDYFTQPRKKKKDFVRLAKQDSRLAGHSMWNFLANYYGRASISNLLYLTRINRSLENGLLYVLGIDSKELSRQWYEYYEKKFSVQTEVPIKFHNDLDLVKQHLNIPLGQMRLRPDGQQLAYSVNDHGRVKLMLYDMQSGDKEVLFRYGVRNFEQEADLNYPVIAWKPDGTELSLMYERRDIIYLTKYGFAEKAIFTDKLSPEYHRVYSMDYWSEDTLAIAASSDGFSDLYFYAPITRQSERLTEDFYDDLDLSVANTDSKRYLLFSSNRKSEQLRKMELDSILPIGPFDLYLFDYSSERNSLRRLTFTADASERYARMSGSEELVCLTDLDGRWQRMNVSRILEDPPIITLTTRYDRDIIRHEYVPGSDVVIDYLQKWNVPYYQTSDVDSIQIAYGLAPVTPASRPLTDNVNPAVPITSQAPDDPKYYFQTEFPDPSKPVVNVDVSVAQPLDTGSDTTAEDFFSRPASARIKAEYDPSDLVPFVRARVIAARLKFKLDYLNTTMDNEVLFGGLDSYAGTKREFEPSPLGLLIKGSVKDLLEDYIITGGARYPTTFNGSEYFLVFDNRKRRIDKQYAIYRKSVIDQDPTANNLMQRNQYVSVLGHMRLSYPFDVYNSLRLSGTLRNDRAIALATDAGTLAKDIDDAQRFGLKLEWVFDNTRILDINSRRGTRAKAWAEVVKRFDLNLFEAGPKLQFNKGMMTVLGFDARHYVSLDRRSVFAVRATGATSIGSERILYYLGGVENWLFPSFDNGVSVPEDKNFAYTSIAANMRGFKYNARNGSSVVLTNAELRVPVLQYLSRQKIRSSFLRNIQVVGFVDAGTAWHGPDPFGAENPLNTVVLTNPPTVEVTVNYYRNPLIVGYGGGLRTMLFGYLMKLDYGWNWETKTNRKPLLHFSIGADF
ncbi:MAG: outer membrane protein assembly factor [Bacteroidota bacterium]|nr:outer membrane protein assembly factor [Bacteroidota bacterium]